MKKIYFISLGCDKNLVDSEVMIGLLAKAGYEISTDEEGAEAALVNTCSFISDAKEESINVILEQAERKSRGELKALIVTGCLAQRYKADILKEIPEIDAVVGTTAYDEIVNVLKGIEEGSAQREYYKDINYIPCGELPRLLSTGGYYGYLKISDGCDKHCTYCAIPSMRGDYRSVPMEQLVSEAERLASLGVRELIIVGQETTVYGTDLYGKKSLSELLRRICAIDGIKWVRVLYCYPEEIDDELIETIATEEKICNYLDLPIQHASDRILKKMGRRTTEADLRALVSKLRERIPDIMLRTTLITGFPGETEEDVQILLDFVREMRFDRLGAFAYSKEEDTPAARMKEQVPQRVKKSRLKSVMLAQQEIAFEKAEQQIGRELEVMVEGFIPDEGIYVCRTYMDAPNVDGLIFVSSEAKHMSGDFIRVRVVAAKDYDLIGEEMED